MRSLYVGGAGFIDRPTGAGLRCRIINDALLGLGPVTVLEVSNRPGLAQRIGRQLGRSSSPDADAARAARQARRDFARLGPEQFDLVWFASPHAFTAVDPHTSTPVIVDIARLESLNLQREVDVTGAADARSRADYDRWRTAEQLVADRSSHVVVCNELDQELLGKDDSSVIPTGIVGPAHRRSDFGLHHPPQLLMQGTLHLEQNVDAARHMVETVLPLVRDDVPDAVLRLVGPGPSELLAELGAAPGVTTSGWVEDISAELASSDVVVAPIRHGGGIHVKVIEAFAHEVPVVTTSIGAEGSHAVSGHDLFVADDDNAFAAHCIELLRDADLRRTLTDHAHALYLEHFDETLVRERFATLASGVARGGLARSA